QVRRLRVQIIAHHPVALAAVAVALRAVPGEQLRAGGDRPRICRDRILQLLSLGMTMRGGRRMLVLTGDADCRGEGNKRDERSAEQTRANRVRHVTAPATV